MDFEVFLWAIGNNAIMGTIRNAFEKRKPLGKDIHGHLSRPACKQCRIHAIGFAANARNLEYFANNIYHRQRGIFGNEQVNTVMVKKKMLIKPAKEWWDTEIEAFHLSDYALSRLKQKGVNKVKDLYATNPKEEPGWYAVRELFKKIPAAQVDD